jgi:phosphoglycolate phosphatase-like HAD superfamily hydrolase
MDESDFREIEDASLDSSRDLNALIVSLRTAGADRFDPVRWHYIDVLAKRAMEHQGSVRRMLDAKLAKALAAFRERFEQAQCDARDAVGRNVQQYPHAARDLQALLDAGDFKALRQFIATLKAREQCASLSALVHRLEHHSPEGAESAYTHAGTKSEMHAETPPKTRSELKTISKFRNTWSKLSADKQVAQALEQAPTNAGPINSHMLVLRSLTLMRDISPDYLNRFMSYADTLLCLDQGEKEKPVIPKKKAAKASKK